MPLEFTHTRCSELVYLFSIPYESEVRGLMEAYPAVGQLTLPRADLQLGEEVAVDIVLEKVVHEDGRRLHPLLLGP